MPELGGFCFSPLSTPLPPGINLPAGKKSYLPAVYIDPQNLNENESEAKNHEHWHRSRLLRHQDSALFLSQPVLQPTAATNLTPARDSLSLAGVFFCLRGPDGRPIQRDKNHQRQLLPADTGCIGAGNSQPRCPHRVYRSGSRRASRLPAMAGTSRSFAAICFVLPSRVQFPLRGVWNTASPSRMCSCFPQGFAALMAEPDLLDR